MPSQRRIRQAVARSRVEDVRLGLRLTARQTEHKSTDKAEDGPADTKDGPAEGETGGPGNGNLTADKHAGIDTARPGKGAPGG